MPEEELNEPVEEYTISEEEADKLVESLEKSDETKWATDKGFIGFVLGGEIFAHQQQVLRGGPEKGQTINPEDWAIFFGLLYQGTPLREALRRGKDGYSAYIHNVRNTGMRFNMKRETINPPDHPGSFMRDITFRPALEAGVKASRIFYEATQTDEGNVIRGIEYAYQRQLSRLRGEDVVFERNLQHQDEKAKQRAIKRAKQIEAEINQ